MKYQQRITILFFCILLQFSFGAWACDCPEYKKLDKTYTDSYNLIFEGAVTSVGTCNKINKVHFIIHDLFQGQASKEIDVYFDCTSDCAMNFNIGETWIIYSNYAQVGKPDVSFCSRSRKQIDNEIQLQSSFVPDDLSFNEELEWLKTNLGIKSFIQENTNAEFSHKNELPSPEKSIVLIIVSFAGMMILYFVLKKYFK